MQKSWRRVSPMTSFGALRDGGCRWKGSGIGSISTNRRSPWKPLCALNSPLRKTWKQLVEEFDDPVILECVSKLVPKRPLWLDAKAEKKVPYHPFFRMVKLQHPEKIVFVRSGEHYHAAGIDAVMLMRYASMKPAGKGGVPRVKCMREELPHYLQQIVQRRGFEAVICEESGPEHRIGKTRVRKQHYVAGIIGGAGDSFYLGSANAEEIANMDLENDYPLAAVFCSQSGYSLIQYFVKQNAVKVISRMSEEGLWAKLNSTGMATPLYIHTSTLQGMRNDTMFRTWERKANEVASSVFGSVEKYNADEPVQGFLHVISSRNPEIDTTNVSVLSEDIKDRVSPPPLSTMSEMGIVPREQSGVLPLMEYILPPRCPKLVVSWMQRCIEDPPPPEIAIEIQTVCRELTEMKCSIPRLEADLPPNQIVEVLNGKELTVDFLDSIRLLLTGIQGLVSDSMAETLASSLLKVVERQTYVPVETESFVKECQICIDAISEVIVEDAIFKTSNASQVNSNVGRFTSSFRNFVDNGEENLSQFFRKTRHPLFDCIHPDLLSEERIALVAHEADVVRAVQMALRELRFDKPKAIHFDAEQCFIVFSVTDTEIKTESVYAPDQTRADKSVPNRLTTHQLSRSLWSYEEALNEWESALKERMEHLAKTLSDHTSCIVTAAHASIIITALSGHITEASKLRWVQPDITSLVSKKIKTLRIDGFWPYWMTKDQSVSNSVSLDRIAILTGPNMAGMSFSHGTSNGMCPLGKSTILRSVAAVCCLGVSGFYVPAESATLPFIDCINLKTLLTDSPLENLSAFGMEMTEMKHVLNDATQDTLVLIDELGKGTEVIGGTAMSAAIFKDLYDRSSFGIFATHLHKIADFKHDFPDAKYHRMEVQYDADGNKASTWKMVDGFCEESLGLRVALEQGIPRPIVDRAQELVHAIENLP